MKARSCHIFIALVAFVVVGCTTVDGLRVIAPSEEDRKGMAYEAVMLYRERTAESSVVSRQLMEAIAEKLVSQRLADAIDSKESLLSTLNGSWFSCRERGRQWVCTDVAVFEWSFGVPNAGIIPASPLTITNTLLILVTIESNTSEFELLVSVQ